MPWSCPRFLRPLPALVAACTLLLAIGCGDQPIPPAELDAYRQAQELQTRGDLDAALARYRTLKRDTRDRRILARVELGIAQIETAQQRHEQARAALETLPERAGVLTLEQLESEIATLLEPFWGTAFEAPLQVQAAETRRRVRERLAAARELELKVVQELCDRGEYGGALMHLRQVELNRAPGDREDVAALLETIERRAGEEADRVLAQFQQRAAGGAKAAVTWLDEQRLRFRGTTAMARLLRARLDVDPDLRLRPEASATSNKHPAD